MKNPEPVRIWFCDCGRVHVEASNYRRSFTPTEFLNFLKNSAEMGGTKSNPPRQFILEGHSETQTQ